MPYNPALYMPTGYQPAYQPPQMTAPNQMAPMMTPPTIRAEIIQISDPAEVDRWPVNAGSSQMFITRDEKQIIIKTMGSNGALPLDVYEKRPPVPPEPVFDPREYVRRDELKNIVAGILEEREGNHEPV